MFWCISMMSFYNFLNEILTHLTQCIKYSLSTTYYQFHFPWIVVAYASTKKIAHAFILLFSHDFMILDKFPTQVIFIILFLSLLAKHLSVFMIFLFLDCLTHNGLLQNISSSFTTFSCMLHRAKGNIIYIENKPKMKTMCGLLK